MRSIEEVHRVQALIRQGLNDCEISRRTGIPRGTVRDWRHGKAPRRGVRGSRVPPEDTCSKCGHPQHDFVGLPQRTYAYLLGLYLGDGTISRARRGVFKLRVVLDAKYPRVIDECGAAMTAVCPSSTVNRIERVGCIEVYSYSKIWPCLFPQHGPGMKHTRSIWLAGWQKAIADEAARGLLRGLIHSDGCRVTNRVTVNGKEYRYPRYFFCNHSADIREIFCRYCQTLGIEWRSDGWKNISIARRESVALLDRFVGPKR
ncbi:MAG TPA: hypothetical protein VLB79_00525 [Solirubrobacterales bacterium]|nr:hypothetical protein [Solirubrobacterales bacterium]